MKPVTVSLVLAGLFAAAFCAAALKEPRRYRADLDPPKFNPPTFKEGQLTGWYVYLYAGDEKLVCANPQVWQGPHVITCSRLVAIGPTDEPPASSPEEPTAQGPHNPVPVYSEYDGTRVDKEIDLWAKRLSSGTRGSER